MSLSTVNTEPIPLLQTKLYRPQASDTLVQRSHLITHLNRGLHRKLTLVTAPAGYGKTTIISQWLNQLAATQQPAPLVAWLSLDEYDDDLLYFLRYLVAAVQTAVPDFGQTITNAIHSRQPLPWHHLAAILANDFAQLPQPLILVLDDYHVITEQVIHRVSGRLLDHLPPSLHLVLLSRTAPLLPLERLRVRRQMTELRAIDLSFSLDETEAFMTQALGKTPQPKALEALYASNEGWVAGLQLAALSQNDDTHSSHFQERNVYATDYLFAEVLHQQPPTIQSFLLQTAVLDRFSVPLAQAILGQAWLNQVAEDDQLPSQIRNSKHPAQTLLRWLQNANLFLIPLDNNGTWYRYHHLFQQMLSQTLRQQFSATAIAARHRLASNWFTAEGLPEEAFHHALAADDPALMVQLIEQYRYKLLNTMEIRTLERWLSELPHSLLANHPLLLVTSAWVTYLLYHKISEIFPLIDQAQHHLKSDDLLLQGETKQILSYEIMTLRNIGWFWQGKSQNVLDTFPIDLDDTSQFPPFLRSYLIITIGTAYQAVGQPNKGLHALKTRLANEQRLSSFARARLLVAIGGIQFTLGDLPACHETFQEALNLRSTDNTRVDFTWVYSYFYLGWINYEWNNLTEAITLYSKGTELLYRASMRMIHQNHLGLALAYQAHGRPLAAQEVINKLREMLRQQEEYKHLNEVKTFQARLYLLQNQVESAAKLIKTANMTALSPTLDGLEISLLTKAKVLLAQGDLQVAQETLQTLKTTAENIQNHWLLTQILVLEALVEQGRGELEKALVLLQQAIALAKPGGFIRTFVDLGQPMAQLLYSLLTQGVEPDYLGRILAAFPKAWNVGETAVSPQPPTSQPLIEPLTAREMETLTLLANRLTNKEIAQQLGVSPSTVKYHLDNIYQKLGTKGRRQAVAQAKALGLL